MGESRDRLVEFAELLLDGLEQGGSMTAGRFAGTKGYEFYNHVTNYIDRHGTSGAVADFVNLMPWGTPTQVLEKIQHIHDMIGNQGLMGHFSYAGMPYEEAERNLRLFVSDVMPEARRIGVSSSVIASTA